MVIPIWALAALALGLATAPACAQSPASSSSQADPADAAATVPPIVHRSALTDYKPLTDEPLRNWREVNDEVRSIGGWREYLREVQAAREATIAKPAAPMPATSNAPPPAAAPRKPHAH